MSNARDKANIPALNFSSTGIDDNATSTAITINSSGSVGINTSSPAQRLHIQTGGTTYLRTENTGISTVTDFGTDGIGSIIINRSAKPFRIFTDSTERMRIDSSGRVGIGTSSPNFPLEIYKASTSEVAIGTDNGGTAQLSFWEGNSSTKEFFVKYDGFNNNGVIGTSGSSNAIVIARDTGRVGIGTTSPQEKLDIDGNIAISGNTLFEEVVSTAGMPSSAGNKSVNTNYDSTFSLTAGKWLILVNASLQVFQTSGNESGLYLLSLSLGSSAGADNYGLIQKAVLKWGNGTNSYGDNTGGHFPILTLGSTTTLHTRWRVTEYGTASNFWVRGNLTRIRCIRIG